MKIEVIEASEINIWRQNIGQCQDADACHLPEYHLAYASQQQGARAILWCLTDERKFFCYPFILSPVKDDTNNLNSEFKDYYDISSVYGYSGPLACNSDKEFLSHAWNLFDKWAEKNNIISDFTRFSPYSKNISLAHPNMNIKMNREIAISRLPNTSNDLFTMLGAKTRNMIRKAKKNNLRYTELEPSAWEPEFLNLYFRSMQKNNATSFFYYNQDYYRRLYSIPACDFRLFGVFHNSHLIATSMIIIYKKTALYHLGASHPEFARLGAGNLALWGASEALIKQGVEYFNLGGGRTTDPNDPLLKFKTSNATHRTSFYIGQRVINPSIYQKIIENWQVVYQQMPDPLKLTFYR